MEILTKINTELIINLMKGLAGSVLKLNEHVTEILSEITTITNVKIKSGNQFIYSYRNDDVKYNKCVQKKFVIEKFCFSIIVCTSNIEQEIKLSMLYDANASQYEDNSAERNICLPELTSLIFAKQGINLDINFIEILGLDSDLCKLKNAVSRGYNIFVSSLGSGLVKYLSDLYFDVSPDGVFHVNGYSTAVELSNKRNLIRLYPPDSLNPPIFVRLSNSNIIIIYSPTGVWSSGLTQSIKDLALEKGKSVTLIPSDPLNNKDYLNLLRELPPTTEPTSVMIISDYGIVIAQDLQESGVLNDFNFNIFFGDASANIPLPNENVLNFLKEHEALIIQPYITQSDINLAEEINSQLICSQASQSLIFLFSAIDTGILLRTMPLEKRKFRKRFNFIEISDRIIDGKEVGGGDNVNGTYAGVQYIGLHEYQLMKIIIVNNDQLFIANLYDD